MACDLQPVEMCNQSSYIAIDSGNINYIVQGNWVNFDEDGVPICKLPKKIRIYVSFDKRILALACKEDKENMK